MGNNPLLSQTCYIRNYRRKLSHASTRKYVGVVRDINNYPTKFSPNYELGKKLSDAALLNPLSARSPKSSRNFLKEHSYNPENGDIDCFIDLCKCTEVSESAEVEKRAQHNIEVNNPDGSSDGNNLRQRKKVRNNSKRKSYRKSKRKSDFYCNRHGQNNSHDTVYCKVLKAELNVTSWKNPNQGEYSNKNKVYWQKKQCEVHMLQQDNFEHREKCQKKIAYLKKKSKNRGSESSNSSEDDIKNGKFLIVEPPDNKSSNYESSADNISSSRFSSSDN